MTYEIDSIEYESKKDIDLLVDIPSELYNSGECSLKAELSTSRTEYNGSNNMYLFNTYTEDSILLGDVIQDGVINLNDAVAILRHCAGIIDTLE